MINADLQRLWQNLDDDQQEIIAGIVLRMASAKAERWTGQVSFIVNFGQGGIGDMQVNRGEVVRLQKKRKVRDSGL